MLLYIYLKIFDVETNYAYPKQDNIKKTTVDGVIEKFKQNVNEEVEKLNKTKKVPILKNKNKKNKNDNNDTAPP